MDLNWEIEIVNKKIKIYQEKFGYSKEYAINHALDMHCKSLEDEPEILEMKQKLREYYKTK